MTEEPQTPTLLEWVDAEIEHYMRLVGLCEAMGHAHLDGDILKYRTAHLYFTAIRNLVAEQQAKETRMKKLKLWSLWILALARFDTQRAKQLADEITNLQKGKPPMNHTNLGG